MCVEECPTVTDFDALWACTDDNLAFTAGEGYDCAGGNQATCAEKADVQPTGGEDGTFGGGDGEGFCMYQVESVDCEWLSPFPCFRPGTGCCLSCFLNAKNGGARMFNTFIGRGRLNARLLCRGTGVVNPSSYLVTLVRDMLCTVLGWLVLLLIHPANSAIFVASLFRRFMRRSR